MSMIEFKVAKVVCWVFFVTFLIAGFYFFLLPENLENIISVVGESLKVEIGEEINFWKSLAFAYMITIAFIAALIATNVTIYWRFLLILFVAKISSSTAALIFS